MKPLVWLGKTKNDLKGFPKPVKGAIGIGLYIAQLGGKPPNAKPLKGYTGASVLEIIEDFDGNTYRAVYTTKLQDVIYVLHIFQKKSTKGIATPKPDLDLIKKRLQDAKELHLKSRGK